MKEYPVFSDAWQDLKISPLWSDLKSYKCNHGGKVMPRSQNMRWGWNEKRKGRYNRAILWPCSIMGVRGGKDRKEDANERVQRSRREGSVWLHRRMVVEGSKGVGGQGRKEGDAGALQSLQVSWKSFSSVRRLCSAMCIWFSRSWNKKQNNNKTSVTVVKDPSERKQTTWPCFFGFYPLSFRRASD